MTPCSRQGFTLIETLVAISLITIAIVAPMSLVSQSLTGAYYARDQVTAYYLAQEGIEAVRAVRDGNILRVALGVSGDCSPMDLLCGIPLNSNFTVDARFSAPSAAFESCAAGACDPLQLITSGKESLYGYEAGAPNTRFTRTMRARFVDGSGENEIRVEAKITWKTASLKVRTFTISENMYRWVKDGAAAE